MTAGRSTAILVTGETPVLRRIFEGGTSWECVFAVVVNGGLGGESPFLKPTANCGNQCPFALSKLF